jgi:hypothetical protein
MRYDCRLRPLPAAPILPSEITLSERFKWPEAVETEPRSG